MNPGSKLSPQKATSHVAHIRRIARINGLDRVNNVDFAKEPLGFTEIPPVVLLCVRRLARSSPMASLSEDLPRPAARHTTHRLAAEGPLCCSFRLVAHLTAYSRASPSPLPLSRPSHGQNQARARVQGTLSTVRIF
jgi:hypothetical protein